MRYLQIQFGCSTTYMNPIYILWKLGQFPVHQNYIKKHIGGPQCTHQEHRSIFGRFRRFDSSRRKPRNTMDSGREREVAIFGKQRSSEVGRLSGQNGVGRWSIWGRLTGRMWEGDISQLPDRNSNWKLSISNELLQLGRRVHACP